MYDYYTRCRRLVNSKNETTNPPFSQTTAPNCPRGTKHPSYINPTKQRNQNSFLTTNSTTNTIYFELLEMEATRVHSKLLLILALVVVAAAATASAAKAKTKDDGGICGVSLSELMECQPAVASGTAEPPKPSDACCASVKHANLTCFCTFKNNRNLPLFGINVTRAMQLPTQCDPTQAMNCA